MLIEVRIQINLVPHAMTQADSIHQKLTCLSREAAPCHGHTFRPMFLLVSLPRQRLRVESVTIAYHICPMADSFA
jgi:hypothetical protein